MKEGLRRLLDLCLPRYCVVCGRRLQYAETCTCARCLLHLPLTRFKGRRSNVVERILWDERIATQRANAFLKFDRLSPYCQIFYHFKYWAHPDVAVYYGRLMALDVREEGFFEGIDLIVPVPLSRRRYRRRGYNQSERLARGIRQVTGLPVAEDVVVRCVDNRTQTQLTAEERRQNVADIFRLAKPEAVRGRHVLLVDDVITTGSTLRACARALLEAEGVRLSVMGLAISSYHMRWVFPELDGH